LICAGGSGSAVTRTESNNCDLANNNVQAAQEVKGREALDKGARVSFASVEEKGLRSSF
jgi:hypothetical protein